MSSKYRVKNLFRGPLCFDLKDPATGKVAESIHLGRNELLWLDAAQYDSRKIQKLLRLRYLKTVAEA